jgi:U3 small nucleolar RNA-associated protein 7
MATSGMDGQLKIFDIRTYKPVHEYFTTSPANCLAISDTGALAVGHGPHVNVWKDAIKVKAKSPYMTHLEAGTAIQDIRFCPYEDVLGVGTAKGFRSLVIPGSGEPNFDSLEANPYQSKSQRQESEVHGLMEKIQPEMITLDPSIIGNIDRAHTETLKEERTREWEANNPKEKFVPRNRQKGKSSAAKRFKRKQGNVIDAVKREYLKTLKAEKAPPSIESSSALSRFNVSK